MHITTTHLRHIQKIIALTCITLLLTLPTDAQSVQGYVKDTETGAALTGITVDAILESDATKITTATTDDNGFYIIDNISSVTDMQGTDNNHIVITRTSTTLIIDITSKDKVETGHLYNLEGTTIAVAHFTQTGINSYHAAINLNESTSTVLLFHYNHHAAVKIPVTPLRSHSTVTTTDAAHLKSTTATNTTNYIFRLTNAVNATYQPLEETKAVDMTTINYFDFNMEKKQTVAYFWRAFKPEIDQNGMSADVIISNSEHNYNDTIFAILISDAWRDTVPVNPTGKTTYTITIIPHVQKGDIPLYTETKTFDLEPGETAQGYDDLKALEQQQKIKGRVMILNGDERVNMTGGVDIIVWNEDRTVKLDSIRSMDGYYETGPYQTGFQGEMDIHIPNNHPTRMDTLYLGHKGIPITTKSENIWGPVSGPAIMEDKVINFEDSIKTYNILLFPTFKIDTETGMLAKVNPRQVWGLDGNNSYDLPTMKWPEGINVYFRPESENDPWVYQMAARIENNFGIPFKINKTETPRSQIDINITSLDDDYLNSIKAQTGMNITTSTTKAGVTYTIGFSEPDKIDGIALHSVDEVRIRCPPEGQQGANSEVIGSLRELVHRINDTNDTSPDLYISISNTATPNNLDTAKMVYDHINFNILYYYRQGRIQSNPKERINSGSYTMRPNNNTDYYSNTSQSDFYGDEERWFHWDTTNIPEWNKKFFE